MFRKCGQGIVWWRCHIQHRAADAGCSVNNIKDTQSLTKVTLNVKHLDWHPRDIIQFVRDNPRLRLLEIQGEEQQKRMKFGKQFKEMFADLIKERGSLTIKVSLFNDNREVEISENGFNVNQLTDSTSESKGYWKTRMKEMLSYLNRL